MNLMRLTLIHNQSRATYYTHDYHVRFHTSQVSLMIRCYNRYIRENFAHHHNHYTRTHMAQDTVHAQGRSTYDLYFEIDCDCEELLDAIGLDYKQCEDDNTQNEVCISLTPSEATDVLDQSILSMTNEQTLAAAVLNHELSEYTTKVTIYTPSGDQIMFK